MLLNIRAALAHMHAAAMRKISVPIGLLNYIKYFGLVIVIKMVSYF